LLKVYTYSGCSTCKKALKFLQGANVDYAERPIREQPPSLEEIRAMWKAYEGNRRKLFNTSGQDYRALGLGAKLDDLTEDEAIALLHGNGNLIKRPFAISPKVHLVGFDEKIWGDVILT
jgi:arsenate reductase (glutaredoxin)